MFGVTAQAGSAPQSINVSLTIGGGCLVNTTGLNVNFGSIASGASVPLNVDRIGTLLVTCLPSLPYAVGFNGGNSPTLLLRQMTHTVNNTDTVDYDLLYGGVSVGDGGISVYDSGYTETIPSIAAITGQIGNGAAQPFIITARAYLLTATGAVGVYKDNVSVIVAW